MRICSKCGAGKGWDEFYTNTRGLNGRDSICKECRRTQRKLDWANNHLGQRDRELARFAARGDEFRLAQWKARLRRVYSITESDWAWLLEQQAGVCALCGEPETKVHHNSGEVMRLTIDHDHGCCPSNLKTCGGCIRGLLCYECNLLVGKVEAKPKLALRFSDYLVRRPLTDVTTP